MISTPRTKILNMDSLPIGVEASNRVLAMVPNITILRARSVVVDGRTTANNTASKDFLRSSHGAHNKVDGRTPVVTSVADQTGLTTSKATRPDRTIRELASMDSLALRVENLAGNTASSPVDLTGMTRTVNTVTG